MFSEKCIKQFCTSLIFCTFAVIERDSKQNYHMSEGLGGGGGGSGIHYSLKDLAHYSPH